MTGTGTGTGKGTERRRGTGTRGTPTAYAQIRPLTSWNASYSVFWSTGSW
ncbi:hypothetical protein QF026_002088 [Streptomyces aurantiacus]|nr:hypothetical protein [Streptomyces aurantiacus]